MLRHLTVLFWSMTYGTMAFIGMNFPNHVNLWSPHFWPMLFAEHSFLRRMLIPPQ